MYEKSYHSLHKIKTYYAMRLVDMDDSAFELLCPE